ncbi:MAG: hypothetical protein ACRD29_12860 [Acidimicrobiales bacterium]
MTRKAPSRDTGLLIRLGARNRSARHPINVTSAVKQISSALERALADAKRALWGSLSSA